MSLMDIEPVLAEQIAYYRARAPEYDDWWERRNFYDNGDAFAAAWRSDIEQLVDWVDAAGPLGDVVELAAGTGNWTRELVARATSVTAVDASPETLAVNASKVPDNAVDYVVADLFDWEPPRTFDTVFFGFWLSHVPAEKWAQFWLLVDRALAPGGQVLFCDNARPDHSEANGPSGKLYSAQTTLDRTTRTVSDGSTFEIVKRYWSPDDLELDLEAVGWSADVAETSFAFIHGIARRSA
jgi:SAM-dependent methyltransferase